METPSLPEKDKKAVKVEEKFRGADLKDSINKLNGDFVDLSNYDSAKDTELTNLLRQDNLIENAISDSLLNGSGIENERDEMYYRRKQPLYIVDGVPVDFTRKASAGKWGDSEYESATDIASLEKESVEILTVEKALELYGDKGKYGAIVITTIEGKKREISYIKSSGDTTYTREDAASMGMMDLINKQKDNKKNNK